jgi:hypothetical protein
MKAKPTKPKRKIVRKAKSILTKLPVLAAENILPEKKTLLRWERKGSKIATRMVESTGIPEGYSATVAWFAERLVLASICLAVASFAFGVLFVLYLSEPIAESQTYEVLSSKARLAQEGVKVYSQQVIDMASPVFASLVKENRRVEDELITEAELLAAQLTLRKDKLKAYFTAKKSPFAEDEKALDAFVASKNMKLMVAISFVESTFGKNCYYYNCSGIGGTPPNLRKYDSYEEWIVDFDDLLERRYKDLPPEKFIGLYVQPGSPNWLYGVKQVLKEFEDQNIEGITLVSELNS